MRRTWDMGDPPPPEEVTGVRDYTGNGEYDTEDSSHWARTPSGWKGYKNGGKVYLDWEELTRRWGPLTEERR